MTDLDSQIEMRLAELLSNRSEDLCERVLAARQLILKLTGECTELIYQTYAVSDVFSYTHRLKEAFLHIAVYQGHANLGFNFGTMIEDPHGLLEGTGKRIRHIRLDSISIVKKPEIKAIIQSAIELGVEMAENSSGILPRRLIDKSV